MRKLYLLLMGVLCLAVTAMAQNRTITGKVTDEKGNPLANVSVLVRGTTNGTTTKADGTYTLSVATGAKALVFSSVDMSPIEMAISSDGKVNATLKAEDKTLQEVVVTGYGTQRRKDLSASIASVKGAAIANLPVQSFEQALAGRATGVQITVPSGVLNAPPVFRIRGISSISLSSQPLIVVDGVVSQTGDFSSTAAAGNALANINPNDIESIDIAKDAAATAIYGSRAAAGVVFITTKRGKAGKARVNYNGSLSWTSPYGVPEVLNAQQYTDYKNMAVANNPSVNGTNPAGTGYTHFATATDAQGNLIDTRWADVVYRRGMSQDHNFNVSGGNDNTTYYLSAGYTNQEGILRKNNFTRKNIFANVDSRINKMLTVGGKLSYSNEMNQQSLGSGSLNGEAFNTNGAGRTVVATAPNIAPYLNNGAYNIENTSSFASNTIGRMNNSVTVGFFNPVPQLDLNRSNSETNHINSNIYVQLKPVKWLTLKTQYGIDYILVDNDIFQSPVHGDGATANGNVSSTYGKFKRWVWDNTAQFDYSFNGKHNVGALIGTEQDRRTSIGFGLNRQNVSDPAFNIIQAGFVTPNTAGLTIGENYMLSKFGRVTYDYNKKYFMSANLRQDEYSAFAIKSEVFYGASLAWDIAKEGFFERSLGKIFSTLKLRGSYGKVGNAGLPDFGIYSTYSGSGLYGGLPTLLFSNAGNSKLKWETSYKTDIGANFGFFKNRLNFEITHFKTDVKGMILSVPQAPSAGVPNAILTNVGSMYNKGWEIQIAATPFQGKNFSWNTTLNFTNVENKVTELAPGLNDLITSGNTSELINRSVVGQSLGQIFVIRNAGVDPATGRRMLYNKAGQKVLYQFYVPAGQFQWTNPDGTQYKENGVAAALTQAKDGVMFNTVAKVYGGWDNTFHYRNFDLNVLCTYALGFNVYYGSNAGLHDQRFWNNAVDVLQAWKKPGDVTTVPRPVYGDNVSNGSALPMSYNVFKGDFVKIKNVTISYNFPQSIIGKANIASARFFISGQNLAIITKYPGPDPEVSSNGTSNTSQSVDRNTIANGRTIVVGINIGF